MSSIVQQIRDVSRVSNFALADVVVSVIAAYYVGPYIGITPRTAMLLVIPVGIITHAFLGVRTPLNAMLGL